MPGDQQRKDVLRERPRNRPRWLRINRGRRKVDRARQDGERHEQPSRPACARNHEDAEEGNDRDKVAGADAEAALPAVERHIECEEHGAYERDRSDLAATAARAQREDQADDRHQQDRREIEQSAIRRDRDAVQRFHARPSHDAEYGPATHETRIHALDARGGEASETDLLIDSEKNERRQSADHEREASAPTSQQRERCDRRRAQIVHQRRAAGHQARHGVAAATDRIQHESTARHSDHEERSIRKKLRAERHRQRDDDAPHATGTVTACDEEDQSGDPSTAHAGNESRADVAVERQRDRIVRIDAGFALDGVNGGIRNRSDDRQTG